MSVHIISHWWCLGDWDKPPKPPTPPTSTVLCGKLYIPLSRHCVFTSRTPLLKPRTTFTHIHSTFTASHLVVHVHLPASNLPHHGLFTRRIRHHVHSRRSCCRIYMSSCLGFLPGREQNHTRIFATSTQVTISQLSVQEDCEDVEYSTKRKQHIEH